MPEKKCSRFQQPIEGRLAIGDTGVKKVDTRCVCSTTYQPVFVLSG
jgi:hypothetical protein